MEITNQEVHQAITSRKQTIKLKGVVVPLASINPVNKLLREKGLTCEIPRYHCMYVSHPRIIAKGEDKKMILLREDVSEAELANVAEQINQYEIGEIDVVINYKNFNNQQQLNWFTKVEDENDPKYVHFPGSFETIGHIAHYNLTEEQEKWKTVIGEITLLKCPNIRTVVNKTEKLHNVYRTPTL